MSRGVKNCQARVMYTSVDDEEIVHFEGRIEASVVDDSHEENLAVLYGLVMSTPRDLRLDEL